MTTSSLARARSLAQHLVQQHALEPPVPIHDLLAEVAEIKGASWPYRDVDALIPSLESSRPTVFYRDTANALRIRFTLAHEWGHIQMLWHGGRRSCQAGDSGFDLIPHNHEQEADLFASVVMAPDQWLLDRRKSADGDMSELLRSLADLELSAIASVRALRRVMLAGWIFRIGTYTVASPGTETALMTNSDAVLASRARATATVTLQRRRVTWFRMFDATLAPEVDDDPRQTTQILRDVLTRLLPDDDTARSIHVVNGVIGGSMSRNTGTADEIYQSLIYRFRDRDLQVLLQDPEFHIFLARKAQAIADGTTVKRSRRGRRSEI